MPKMKTNRAAAKRFRVTGSGKIRRSKGGLNHGMQEKSKKRLRRLRKNDMVDKSFQKRIKLMLPYQVTSRLMAMTGNPNTKFMHCLPALHNTDTQVGQEIYETYGLEALEVTDEVFESKASIVFDQSENRLHTIKSVLVATLGD